MSKKLTCFFILLLPAFIYANITVQEQPLVEHVFLLNMKIFRTVRTIDNYTYGCESTTFQYNLLNKIGKQSLDDAITKIIDEEKSKTQYKKYFCDVYAVQQINSVFFDFTTRLNLITDYYNTLELKKKAKIMTNQLYIDIDAQLFRLNSFYEKTLNKFIALIEQYENILSYNNDKTLEELSSFNFTFQENQHPIDENLLEITKQRIEILNKNESTINRIFTELEKLISGINHESIESVIHQDQLI